MRVYHIDSSSKGMHSRMIKEIHLLQKNPTIEKIKVVIWNRDEPSKNILSLLREKKVELDLINIFALYGNININIFKFWFVLFNKIKREIDKEDVVWVHGLISAIPIALLKLFRKDFKFIYDIHDLDFELIFQRYPCTFGKLLKKILEKIDFFICKKANKILVPTEGIGGKFEGIKEFYLKKGIEKQKIVTVWNVPELNEFLDYTEIKKHKKFTVGYIGLIREEAKIPLLVLFDAVKKLSKNYKIILVGEGTAKKELEKISKQKYPELDIVFVGYVERKSIPNYYKMCDALFSVMSGENITNVRRAIQTKIFESTVLGVPVIVQENTLNVDFVKKYNCGVVIKELSVEEVKKALEKVKKVKFNPEKIRKEWNWKNEEKKLIKVFEELINENCNNCWGKTTIY